MGLSRDERTVRTGSTPMYIAQLEKAVVIGGRVTHRPLPLAEISSATLTYHNDDSSSTIINGRSSQDVLNANDVTISETGLLTWHMTSSDTAMVDSSLDVESHTATFTITTTDGQTLHRDLKIYITNPS